MNNEQALRIIEKMIQNREVLAEDTLTPNQLQQTQQIIKALQLASQALQSKIDANVRKSTLPNNAGKPWSEQEDQQIIEAFNNGESIASIAERHQRTQGSIRSRLSKHGIATI